MSTQPTSAAKLAANKANAQRSTGPRTAEGKSRVADNAIKHGLRSTRNPLELSAEVALPIERDAFQTTLAGLMDDFQPIGTLETQLVERLAQLNLRLNRAARMETAQFSEAACSIIQFHLDKLPDDQPARDNALVKRAFFHSPEGMKLLGQYESRISREFARTLAQLRQSQKQRTADASLAPEKTAEQTQPSEHKPTASHLNLHVGAEEAEPQRPRNGASEATLTISDKQTQATAADSSGEPKPNGSAKPPNPNAPQTRVSRPKPGKPT